MYCVVSVSILGWAKFCQNQAIIKMSKTIQFQSLLRPKMTCLVWSNWLWPQIPVSWGHSNYLVSQSIWKTLGSYFLCWNWKSMWKSYIVSIFLISKFLLLVIFGTLFSEKCQFLGNFDRNLFLPHHQHTWTKNALKTIINLFWNNF